MYCLLVCQIQSVWSVVHSPVCPSLHVGHTTFFSRSALLSCLNGSPPTVSTPSSSSGSGFSQSFCSSRSFASLQARTQKRKKKKKHRFTGRVLYIIRQLQVSDQQQAYTCCSPNTDLSSRILPTCSAFSRFSSVSLARWAVTSALRYARCISQSSYWSCPSTSSCPALWLSQSFLARAIGSTAQLLQDSVEALWPKTACHMHRRAWGGGR